MKQIVKLRIKKLAKGQGSYYLDWCQYGKRFYDYLQLYVDLEHTDKATVARNKEIERIAMQLRNKKEDEIIYGGNDIKKPVAKDGATFFDYLSKLPDTSTNICVKKRCARIFSDFPMVKFSAYHIQEFLSNISHDAPSTRSMYISSLKRVVKLAIDDNYVHSSILKEFPLIKRADKPVTYLTPDEVRLLVSTEGWLHEDNRRAFLFSCLTGLRVSDLLKLTWGEITSDGYIQFSQQKTQIDNDGNAYAYTRLPLNPQALEIAGERGDDSARVFPGLRNRWVMNDELKRIAKKCGITKRIHIHMARQTCGVMLASNGVDIYTISKLLGHKNISTTTKFYANITDEHARESINKLPTIGL